MSIKYSTNGDLQERYVYMDKRLPEEYQEVEYIESSGSQYLNLGFTPPSNYLKTEIKLYPTQTGDRRAGGIYDGSNRANVHYMGIGGVIQGGFGGSDCSTGVAIATNTLYEIEMTANSGSYTIKLNGQSYTGTYSGTVQVSTAIPYYLFANQENGTPKERYYGRMYYFKATTSEGLIRDLVPCYRISDDVIGMYDLVNKVFYTNQGTGTFTKGNDQDTPGLRNITEVYVGTTKVRPVGWKPGANTIAYYPLDSTNTVNDMKGSGTAYNLSNNGGVTFGTNAGVSCANFPGNNNYRLGTSISTLPQSNSARTFSFWFYDVSGMRFDENLWFWGGTGSTNHMVSCGQSNGTAGRWISQYGSSGYSNSGDEYNKWIYCTITYNGSKFSVYKNNNLLFERTYSINTSGQTFRIGGGATWSGTHYFKGYISEFIIENKARTDQERSNYYNLTKGDYGL